MALEGGVNSSGKEKLAQYEVLERLHQAYKACKLKKTMLAYFLYVTKKDRHKALKCAGSNLVPTEMQMPQAEELPVIWLWPGWQR